MEEQPIKEQINDVKETEKKEKKKKIGYRDFISIYVDREKWLSFSYQVKRKKLRIYKVLEKLITEWIKENE